MCSVSGLGMPLSLLPNTVWRERRAFAYYFQHAAASVGGGLDLDFWRTIVPQVCRSEPAVWDAMICISVLFESPDASPDIVQRQASRTLNQNQQDALDWYARSVSAVRQGISRGTVDAFVGLITCVLFICIESLFGSLEEVMRLYAQGVQLILTLRARRAFDGLALLQETIIPIFARLGLFAPKSCWDIAMPLLKEIQEQSSTSTHEFASLKTAREAIVVLGAEIPILELACEKYLQSSGAWYISDELMQRQMILATRLERWHTAFTNLMKSLRATKAGLPASQVSASALLITYYEMLSIILAVCVSPMRVTTDAFTLNFQTIVEQSSIALDSSVQSNGVLPPFTFEISIGLPLWFTCLRCREPTIRREALNLLARSHRIQGMYKREHGMIVGEKIILLEEAIAMSTVDASPSKECTPTTHGPNHYGDLSPDSPLKIPPIKVTTSPSPPHSDIGMDIRTLAALIPQEARIRPHDVFRPCDGFPPEITEEDIALWGQDRDQYFLQFSWNDCDPLNETWKMVFGCIPIDV
ncbi:hypothetical protein N7520_001963 [Penicillium odoratum]|uniref:uncharacterized protein n=1 Tax=Penicillium odoratum TaxID=1167516 RepID=UPI002546B3A9|nr:uncharacterized protein N7520_001963 [Penicillium odoratum]KAJ5778717.1 hypothetical protein N7520_001963 [Penicillium odoratum]